MLSDLYHKSGHYSIDYLIKLKTYVKLSLDTHKHSKVGRLLRDISFFFMVFLLHLYKLSFVRVAGVNHSLTYIL